MTSPRRRLTVVPNVGRREDSYQCRVASQAVMEGTQDFTVQAVTPLAGPGHGQIAVRVGRLLIYVNNREALESILDAWQQAADLADKAFGVVLPPQVYKPRSRA
jgi:hypothetical protein